ncbi:MAG: hypothetical protein LBT84_07550 [Spirochaetia bacterium]|jgi:methyl-accepting chemotaxis protein|nr:hypothetical protein [Spirochaetia bacterium]
MDSRVIVDEMEKTANKITQTARSNNRYSRIRKDVTNDGLDFLSKVFVSNNVLDGNFKKIFANFEDTANEIDANTSILDSDKKYFEEAIAKVTSIKEIFENMNAEIDRLTDIVEIIKNDTDEIFSLALNASIVSSKYSRTSGVFDILANKLNEMSNFIGQNLENIIKVVDPITDGLSQLINSNGEIISKTDEGYKNFTEFITSLEEEQRSIRLLIDSKGQTHKRINDQLQMLNELKKQLNQMSADSDEAIRGSGNNVQWAEQLASFSIEAKNILRNKSKEKDFVTRLKKKITDIRDLAHSIFLAASNVNVKSVTQLEFSKTCVDFCNLIIKESNTVMKNAEDIDKEAKDNNATISKISTDLQGVDMQVQDLISMLNDAQTTMEKFNLDYNEIDNIVGFLRGIMKSMNLIGMLSRIESSREPDEYMQFMTISENIRALQAQIHDNIPNIEDNIDRTKNLINSINLNFEDILSDFSVIGDSGVTVRNNLSESVENSVNSQKLSSEIMDESKSLSENLVAIRDSMNQMLEIMPHPIEGGAFNRDSARKIEEMCASLEV